MKPRDLPLHAALTSSPSSGPLNRMVTLCLSPWILGLTFLCLPRLTQAQNVTSGTTIYGTGLTATDWTGGTISSGATLQLDSGGTISGNATNNGTLSFNRNTIGDPYIYTGIISGTGAVTKSNTGTVTLSGANTYTGTTTISAGNLTLQSTNASSAYVIAGGATLEINNAGNLNFATTTYSGTGTFKKTGAGEVVWTDSVATFALGSGSLIDVQAGTMVAGNFNNEVWTSNLSDLTVASGATFDGVEANIRVDALNGGGHHQVRVWRSGLHLRVG